ncbi:MAG TPA: hypothetical protein VKV15_05760 [Bryobacteraceae bacterium]|nr:hypothetical protein [Bryobacteraceae bacterium]
MTRITLTAAALALILCFCPGYAIAQTIVYSSLPIPQPPNVPSEGFECCGTAELGDQVQLAGTARVGGFVTVLMSDWAKHSDYPSMSSAGYTHPITLAIYDTVANARAHNPLFSVTQPFLIPWRPEPDPTCIDTGFSPWRSPVDQKCYNGFAFTITFDVRHAGIGGAPVQLPDTLIFGVAYNTSTWGYHPLGVGGPYDSLNVGLNSTSGPSVGTDVNPDVVFWNTHYGYTDNGADGLDVFRPDTGWAPYVPAVQISAYTFATTADSCKNGGWQNLVRTDFTGFKNQGDCVSYTRNGK